MKYEGAGINNTSWESNGKFIVIPPNGDNIIYYRWTVPSRLNGADFTIKGEVLDSGRVIDSKTYPHPSERRPSSQTSDTVFEKNAPAEFSAINPLSRAGNLTAQWSERFYENNQFVRRTYGLRLDTSDVSVIVPDVNSPSREQKSDVWYMRSGYGFTADWNIGLQTLSGVTAPTAAMYTESQSAMMYFPEFKYSTAVNRFRVLDRTAANKFQLPVNPDAKNARLHFVPLWFPNGNYRVQGYIGDVWTPAGMMSGYMDSANIVINQSVYDDWVIAQEFICGT